MNSLLSVCKRPLLQMTSALLLLNASLAVAAPPGDARPSSGSLQAFQLKSNDRVALVGATFIERDRHYGYLETMLRIHHPGLKLSFRNMAWPGDTTHTRLRPLNYGTFEENLVKQKPTVVLVSYGVNDSLAGLDHLESFLSGYKATLATFSKLKLRTLLVSPPPFENLASAPYRLDSQNNRLEKFVNATGRLAEDERVSFVNLFRPLYKRGEIRPYPLTDNGLHLSEYGYWKISQVLAEEMGLPVEPWRVEIVVGRRKVHKSGLRIRNVQSSSGGVRFSAIDNFLPLVPPKTAPAGTAAIPGRQLVIKGLSAGDYTLKIDGAEILTATAARWEQGLAIDQGPQFAQSQLLREEVKLKNDLFFYQWRAHNGEYIYGRRASTSEKWDPAKDGGNAGNPSFPKEMAEFGRLINESEARANKLSKPLSHQYELVRQQ